MLALTRKKGESIIIGDNIEVVIISVSGDSVKLGIAAPRSIAVNRKEIYEQIQAENKRAASSAEGLSALRLQLATKKRGVDNSTD